MSTLRISQHSGKEAGRYRFELSATGRGLQQRDAAVEFPFALSPQDQEALRWYLEDFLEFDQDPAPTLARDVERRMEQIGQDLFGALFSASEEARQLWSVVRPQLADTRVEIASEIGAATAIPWELMRDPTLGAIALRARSLVRTRRGAVAALAPVQDKAGKVRILLVICRPRGAVDVPFRSIANRLVKSLSESPRERFDLDVLRPPTYEELARVLGRARDRGQPYHIVHFDGHGVYGDAADLVHEGRVLDAKTKDRRGHLVFEDPAEAHNTRFVDGATIGRLLAQASVPVLVLNACQSDYAEAAIEPHEIAPSSDQRNRTVAYGSLAQEVIDAGAAGVVAMRYSVYVAAATQFVAELYAALARGLTLGESVTRARKHLADHPERQVAYDPRPLQDWCVPVVYERTELRLWPTQDETGPKLEIHGDERGSEQVAGALARELPAPPDAGFFGRDESLFNLDRAFDQGAIVLLHAYAGSGKTATAAEFARWYAQTGGVDGPVLWSSFERHLPLERILDKFGETFGESLEQVGVHWAAITDETQRRQLALQVLARVPVLWIWDNVEPVTGFPKGTPSEWTSAEQQTLREFLLAARDTKAKFLLTSRHEEREWLEELPIRIQVPPMPMRERLEMASAIARRRGKRLQALPDLRPLLEFALGNPLTILVTVSQALRDDVDTAEKLEGYVTRLRAGEAELGEDDALGRARSLGASLSYGFARAFDDAERKILALLHLFQGFVDVDVIVAMGDPKLEACLSSIRGISIERVRELLDRASEVGLLSAKGDDFYDVHPAVPWHFRGLFEKHYPWAADQRAKSPAREAQRAFVSAMGTVGSQYQSTYNSGRREFLATLRAQEKNLLAAWRLARAAGWRRDLIAIMQGLRVVYASTGERSAWERLVLETRVQFPELEAKRLPATLDESGELLLEYLADLARERRDLKEAVRIRKRITDRMSKRVARLLSNTARLTESQRHQLEAYWASLQNLGDLELEQNVPNCVQHYKKALSVLDRLGETRDKAKIALSLGNWYMSFGAGQDLRRALQWYQKSLELRTDADHLGKARSSGSIGGVLKALSEQVGTKRGMKAKARVLLAQAAQAYERAFQLLAQEGPDVWRDWGTTHHQLGGIYASLGDLERAQDHWREAIRVRDENQNFYASGRTRFNAAHALYNARRLDEAAAYAHAALESFERYGDEAAEEIGNTKNLLKLIAAGTPA